MSSVGTGTFWSGKHVLVTGASGLVGALLSRRLVEAGASVVALVRDVDPQSELYRSGLVARVNVVNGRLEDYAAVERAITDHEVDTVFHLGAQTIVGSARRAPLQAFETNIRGTWHVLEAARHHGGLVRRVVVASSDKAYGDHPDLPYREGHPLRGRAPYEVSKSCADLIAQSYFHTYATPVAVVRCGNIYGPGDLNWSRLVPGTIRSLIRGEQPLIRSDGTFLRDYLYVDDVAAAYLQVAEAVTEAGAAGEDYNVSDESPRSVLAMYDAVCQAMGREDVEPLVLNEASGEIRDQFLDASKARDRLGWRPAWTLEDALRETVAWYRDLLGS
ncbi:MAG TPA: NAD-dependent epimerase/dehydratase family protein [Egibacteraceae bacterium]|jgi:CDP-glucose 4,6-dehydratase|nr:NAD-dependent epimerase/dehydratase family protein [Egibacteraceae bacterium]